MEMSSAGVIEGVASDFTVVDSYGERITADSFTQPLPAKLPIYFNHDKRHQIGEWTSVRIEGNNLIVRGRIDLTTTKGQAIRLLLKSGRITGLSVGGMGIVDADKIIRQFDLKEVSVVSRPANKAARVTLIRNSLSAAQLAAAINRGCAAL